VLRVAINLSNFQKFDNVAIWLSHLSVSTSCGPTESTTVRKVSKQFWPELHAVAGSVGWGQVAVVDGKRPGPQMIVPAHAFQPGWIGYRCDEMAAHFWK